MRLEGKVALISGGARGQGAEEARLFAKEGAKVVFGDVLDDLGLQVEAEIRELKDKLDEKKIASEILIFKIHEAATLEDVDKLKKKFPSKFFMSYT